MEEEKRDFREVAEDTWTRGMSLEDLYKSLSISTDDQMQFRIEEIRGAIKDVQRKGNKRQSNSMIETQLNNELKLLELFPEVKATMDIIARIKAELEAKYAKQSAQVVSDKEMLSRLEEQEKEQKAMRDRAKQIDEDIAKMEVEMEALSPEDAEGYIEQIEAMQEEKAKLCSQEDYIKTKTSVINLRQKIGVLETDNKKTQEKLLKCEDPWNKLVSGRHWKEIADLSEVDISAMIGVNASKSKEDKPKDKTPKDKDKKVEDKEEKKEEKKNKNRGKDNIYGSGGIGFSGGTVAPELKLEDETEEVHEELSEEEQEINEEESTVSTSKKPSIFQRLKLKAMALLERAKNSKILSKFMSKQKESKDVKDTADLGNKQESKDSWTQRAKTGNAITYMSRRDNLMNSIKVDVSKNARGNSSNQSAQSAEKSAPSAPAVAHSTPSGAATGHGER